MAFAVITTLSIGALLVLVQIFTHQSLNAAKLRFETDDCALAEVEKIRNIIENLGYLGRLFLLLSIIFLCNWTNLSCKNGWLFHSSNLQSPLANTLNTGDVFTHGWAVAWHFIPIGNLWKPLQPMSFIRNEVSATFKGGAILGIC